jgi:hypothetical protein
MKIRHSCEAQKRHTYENDEVRGEKDELDTAAHYSLHLAAVSGLWERQQTQISNYDIVR